MVKIPQRLREKDFRFVKIKEKEKAPFEEDWTGKNNYKHNKEDFEKHLKGGGNYGVACGHGDLVVIDCDEEEVEEAVKEHLPDTFTVETGGGGHHFYYVCEDLDKPIRLKEEKMGDLGDVQYKGKQVVGPNSTHPSGNKYEVVNDLEIAAVKAEEIRFALRNFIKQRADEMKKTEREKIEDEGLDIDLDIEDVVSMSQLTDRGGEYQGSHPVHGSDTGRNFTVDTAGDVWHCFRHDTGGGPLSWIAVEEGIIDCSDATPGALQGGTFKDVLEVAKEKYDLDIDLGTDFKQLMKKALNIESRDEKKEVMRSCVGLDHTDRDIILQKLQDGCKKAFGKKPKIDNIRKEFKAIAKKSDKTEKEKGKKLTEEEGEEAKRFWNQENPILKIQDVLSEKVKEDREGCLLTVETGASCYGKDPGNLFLRGPPSSGKTYLATSVGKLFPEEDVWFLGGMSPTAFYHDKGEVEVIDGEEKKVIDLSNKLLIFLDEPETELLDKLQPILSHDVEETEFPYTDKELDVTKAVVRGHPAVIFCTTESSTLQEMASRGLSYTPKLSNEKIEASLGLQSEEAIFPELEEFHEEKFEKMRNNFRYLREREIRVKLHGASEFKDWFWKKQNPENGQVNQRVMRDYEKILKLIEVSAFLNHANRPSIESDGDVEYILPRNIDFLIGLNLWEKVKEMTVKGVSKKVLKVLEAVKKLREEEDKEEFYVKSIKRKYEEMFEERLNVSTLRGDYLNEDLCKKLGALRKEKDSENKNRNLYKPVDLEVSEEGEKDKETGINLVLPKQGFISPEIVKEELKSVNGRPGTNKICKRGEDVSSKTFPPRTNKEIFPVLMKLFDGSISEKELKQTGIYKNLMSPGLDDERKGSENVTDGTGGKIEDLKEEVKGKGDIGKLETVVEWLEEKEGKAEDGDVMEILDWDKDKLERMKNLYDKVRYNSGVVEVIG